MSARNRLLKIANRKPAYKLPTPPPPNRKWNIVRGDRVQVVDREHSEFRKQGIVTKVLRKHDRVIVEGVNMKPKLIKGDRERGIPSRNLSVERPLPYHAVNLVDPESNKPTRVVRKFLEDGTKVRVSKRSGVIIPRPDHILTQRKASASQAIVTDSCTKDEDVWAVTYQPKGLRD